MEDLPKRLALSSAGKIAKRLGTISGGSVLDALEIVALPDWVRFPTASPT